MGNLTRRKLVGFLALGGILSLPVLNCTTVRNTSETPGTTEKRPAKNKKVNFSWNVPDKHKDPVTDNLKFEGSVTPDDVKSPAAWLIIGGIVLDALLNKIVWLSCQKYPGILIDARGEELKIRTEPDLLRGMVILRTKDKTEYLECGKYVDSTELYIKLFAALSST